MNKKLKIGKKREKNIQVYEIVDEWLNYKKNMVKESTYYNYMQKVEKYIKPYLKKMDNKNLINHNNFICELSKKLSSKTVRDIMTILKSILKYYQEEYKFELKVKKYSIPKTEKKQIKIFSQKEIKKIEKYCLKCNTLKNIGIIICLNTGMRIGEICGLKWENIDLRNKEIYVSQTIQRIYNKRQKKTRIIINSPKTANSERNIPISEKLYGILKEIEGKYKKYDFFLTGSKKFIEPRTYQKYFKSVLEKLEIDYKNFHTLRHTFACNCLDVGMDVKTLSEILGHSDVNITLNVYIHSSDKNKKKYLDKL